jgi:hypothetical protein
VTVRKNLGMLKKKFGVVKVIELLLRLATGGFWDPGGPDTPTERFTVPLNPFKAPTRIVDWLEPPAGIVSEGWAGAR